MRPAWWRGGRRRRRAGVLLAVAVVAVVGALALRAGGGGPGYRTEETRVSVVDGPADDEQVELDTTLYLPEGASASTPVPAVLASHGFGGDKRSLHADAVDLAEHGYAVLLYSARGFGRSGGQVALASPDYEVKDARQLLDTLARRPEVLQDGPGDPRVGLVGPSYGGGISLMTAAADPRVDALVPLVTWHSLATAFSPNAATPDGGAAGAPAGAFKQVWAGLFFGAGGGGGGGGGAGAGGSGGDGGPGAGAGGGGCGRFVLAVCAAYTETATAGRATPAALELLGRSSPAGMLDRVRAPTMLVQGEADTLFPLEHSVANAKGIGAASPATPVKLVWIAGGHDAPSSDAEQQRVRELTRTWFDRWLHRNPDVDTGPGFEYERPRDPRGSADGYPSAAGTRPLALHPAGPASFVSPPGGQPAAVSGLPGLGAVGRVARAVVREVPGQAAVFESDPLPTSVEVVGAPSVRLRVSSSTGSALLFAKLYDAGPGESRSLPQSVVAPLRVVDLPQPGSGLPGREVEVTLPTLSYTFPAGHRLRLVVASTDQAYANERFPATYAASLDGEEALRLPVGPPAPYERPLWLVAVSLLGLGLAATAALVPVVRARRRRTRSALPLGRSGAPAVEVRGLTKSYADGHRAVDEVSFRVDPGQVVGLLGPNGAGKTTTLRMLLGLITPSSGDVRVFGEPVASGAPVLARVGAFVEGPGFLPHLSGMDNLRLWWGYLGAPWSAAYADEALAVAGLGAAVDKPVRTYSQGMRQRLAIAQAMLGRPDLLVLDEPTNGLDPPQIREVREVISRLAAEGRTVLLSSHLLAEVEQVCTHLVVMARGRLVAAGPVGEVVGSDTVVQVQVDDPAGAMDVLARLPGASASPHLDGEGLLVELDGLSRTELVTALVQNGVGVTSVTSRRRLEDVFLGLVGPS